MTTGLSITVSAGNASQHSFHTVSVAIQLSV